MIKSYIRSFTEASGLEKEEVFLSTSLRMVLLLLLLYVDNLPLNGIIVPILVLPGLLLRQVMYNRFYWLLLATIFVVSYLVLGLRMYLPNHKYIFSFLMIVTTIVMFARHAGADWKHVFSKSTKLIIGFCFLFATIGKFLAPEFLNGAFFEFTCLTDERFHGMTSILTGIPVETLYDGYLSFMNVLSGTDTHATMTLASSPILRQAAYVLSYWTIFIEGMIAITFLAPEKSWLHRHRDWFLIGFIITTYPIATVPGFASTLALLAFVQSFREGKPSNYSFFYLLLFLAIPLFRIPFLMIFKMIVG